MLFELICCSVTNVCKMDSHPPARRPHKSPAHTVKDRGTGLSAAFRTPSPKCPREPHIIQSFSGTSTPREEVFRRSGRCAKRASRRGARIVPGRGRLGKGVAHLTEAAGLAEGPPNRRRSPPMRPITALLAAFLATGAGCASADDKLGGTGRAALHGGDRRRRRRTRARTDVPRRAGRRPRHAVHPRPRGTAGLLDEEHAHPARHPVFRRSRAGWCRSSATCRPARPAIAARRIRAMRRRATCWNSMRAKLRS